MTKNKERRHVLMDENTLNPTMNDILVCPKCENNIFYHTDYNREFCSNCRREMRAGPEFKGGKLLKSKPMENDD